MKNIRIYLIYTAFICILFSSCKEKEMIEANEEVSTPLTEHSSIETDLTKNLRDKGTVLLSPCPLTFFLNYSTLRRGDYYAKTSSKKEQQGDKGTVLLSPFPDS